MSKNKSPKTANPKLKTRPHGLTSWQTGLLVFLLAFILVIVVGGVGLVAFQEGYWKPVNEPPVTSELTTSLAAPTMEVYQMPATWTPTAIAFPTPTITKNPGDMAQDEAIPTAIPSRTASPVASLTPAFDQWQIVIGHSVRNRSIEVFRFGVGKKERMIVAGIHGGNEWNTIALADEMIEYLILHPDFVPTDTSLYILRSLNPDGEAIGHKAEGRANANGVDLNRNFEVNWKSSWKTEGCWVDLPVSAGSAPGSEPETQALMKFLLARHVEALVSYHSAGLGIFPSGDPPDPTSIRLAQAIAKASGYRYPPVNTGCEYTGSLVDWAQQHGVTAVDLELSVHDRTEFDRNLKILTLLLTWK
jgi:protein MpaA